MGKNRPYKGIFPLSSIAAVIFFILYVPSPVLLTQMCITQRCLFPPGYSCALIVLPYSLTLLLLSLLWLQVETLPRVFCHIFVLVQAAVGNPAHCREDPGTRIFSDLWRAGWSNTFYRNSAQGKSGLQLSAAFRSTWLRILLQNLQNYLWAHLNQLRQGAMWAACAWPLRLFLCLPWDPKEQGYKQPQWPVLGFWNCLPSWLFICSLGTTNNKKKNLIWNHMWQ